MPVLHVWAKPHSSMKNRQTEMAVKAANAGAAQAPSKSRAETIGFELF